MRIFWLMAAAVYVTHGFEWMPTIQNEAIIYTCANSDVTFPWKYVTGRGETVNKVTWTFVSSQAEESQAQTMAVNYGYYFLPMMGYTTRQVESFGNAGLVLRRFTPSDFGNYSVTIISTSTDGTSRKYQQKVTVMQADAPKTADGRLYAALDPNPVLDTLTGMWRAQLTCGTFTYLGIPAASVVWITPSGAQVPSTGYSEGKFTLFLSDPAKTGSYSCFVDQPKSARSCFASPALLTGGAVWVNAIQARQVLEVPLAAAVNTEPPKTSTAKPTVALSVHTPTTTTATPTSTKLAVTDLWKMNEQLKMELQECKRTCSQSEKPSVLPFSEWNKLVHPVESFIPLFENISPVVQDPVSDYANCEQIFQSGDKRSGVKTIYPSSQVPIHVYCDQNTDGGGWTVFQRREDGRENFYKGWIDYKHGFGDPAGEFWLGLNRLHVLTSEQPCELRVDMKAFNGTLATATYSKFQIADEENLYRLQFDEYIGGTAGDGLGQPIYGHKNQPFSTKDVDHDSSLENCAREHHGAWWYSSCLTSNLNGDYKATNRALNEDGISWMPFINKLESLQRVEMKLRCRSRD